MLPFHNPGFRPWRPRDLQLLLRPVGREGGQEAEAIAVDAQHGESVMADLQPGSVHRSGVFKGHRGPHRMAQHC